MPARDEGDLLVGSTASAEDYTMLPEPPPAFLGWTLDRTELLHDEEHFMPVGFDLCVRLNEVMHGRVSEGTEPDAFYDDLVFQVVLPSRDNWRSVLKTRWLGAPDADALLAFPIEAIDAAIVDGDVADEQMSAWDVVDDIHNRTGLPVSSVVKAAGISSRTYYSWKKAPSTSPRLGSLGRLWELLQAVEDIEDLVTTGRWLATDARRKKLEEGLFDELVEDAVRQSRPDLQAEEPISYRGDDRVVGDLPTNPGPGTSRRLR